MVSAAYYRREAERARKQAVNSKDSETVLWWLRIARDYRALAEAMESEEQRPSTSMPPPAGAPHQQPVQQQQNKLGTDEPLEC